MKGMEIQCCVTDMSGNESRQDQADLEVKGKGKRPDDVWKLLSENTHDVLVGAVSETPKASMCAPYETPTAVRFT